MPSSLAMHIGQRRILLSCLGGGAGLVFWLLVENWANSQLSPFLYLALLSFVGSYSTLALALVGPVSVRRALVGALILALPFTGLILLAGARYDLAIDVLEQPILISVALLVLLVSAPFLGVALQNRQAWRNYEALFEMAWALTIRYLLAWLFVGLFWLLMFLSDALLSLVDIEIIEWITDSEWLVFTLTGGVLGLALTVVFELRAMLSPFLLLRLLRLLVLPVVVVVAVFLAAIPVRGLSQVFGDFSAAATLMSVAAVMISLIAVVLERDDARMRKSITISQATRFMVVLLPMVTGLAAWSIWLRISDYGWTPDRVLAACVSGVLLGYGGLYSLSIVSGGQQWTARIRRSNVILALVTIGLCVALLAPVINAERISANNQVSRFLDGRLPLKQLPLWELKNDWGRAGQTAFARLKDSPQAQSPELTDRFQHLQSAKNRWEFSHSVSGDTLDGLRADLVELMPVLPQGEILQVKDLEGLREYQLKDWLKGCRHALTDGRPGCILIMDQFDPNLPRQGLLLYRSSGHSDALDSDFLMLGDGVWGRTGGVQVMQGDGRGRLNTSDIEAILDGNYTVGPSSRRSLYVDSMEILPRP